MTETVRVTAAPGLRVPMEGKPQTYVTEAQPQDVPLTAYYARRIRDGELLLVPDPQPRKRT